MVDYKIDYSYGEWGIKEDGQTIDLSQKENLSVIVYMLNGYNNLKKEVMMLKTANYYSVPVEDYRKECERLVLHTNEIIHKLLIDMVALEGSSPSILKTADKLRDMYEVKED